MTTLAMPHSPTPSSQPMHSSGRTRYVAVRANLLPDELVAARRQSALKHRLIAGLGALLVVLIAWYGFSAWATSSARHDLAAARQHNADLAKQQAKYQPLVTAQQESTAIHDALARLMVGDLSWKDMLTTLRANAKHGVRLSSVSATMYSGAAAGSATGQNAGIETLNQSGKQSVGTLTIAGTAPDKNTVAGYVDALGKIQGLAAAFPANVTTAGSRVSFTVNVIITTGALGGRYTAQSATSGGN